MDPVAQIAARDFVMRALAELTKTERVVITLRYYSDLSEAEIADELNIPPGTVKGTAARALRKLRAVVEPGSSTATENDQGATR